MTDQQAIALPAIAPRAKAFRRVAALFLVFLVVGIVCDIYYLFAVHQPMPSWLDENLELMFWQVYGIAYFVVFAVSAVLFLMWHYRVHHQLHAVHGSGVKFTPGWVIAGWVIPFANLVLPYLVMRSSWRASFPSMNRSDGHLPGYLILWWLGYLIGETLTSVADSMFQNADTVMVS